MNLARPSCTEFAPEQVWGIGIAQVLISHFISTLCDDLASS